MSSVGLCVRKEDQVEQRSGEDTVEDNESTGIESQSKNKEAETVVSSDTLESRDIEEGTTKNDHKKRVSVTDKRRSKKVQFKVSDEQIQMKQLNKILLEKPTSRT